MSDSIPSIALSSRVSRRDAVRSLAVLIGGASVPLCLAAPQLAAADRDRKPVPADPATTPPPIASAPLADGITHVSGVGGNIVVLSGDDGGLVIDCGVPDAAKGTVAEISKAAPKRRCW